MSSYLPADVWQFGDPPEGTRTYWVSVRRVRDGFDFVEKLTWFGAVGRWGSPYDTDRLHFKLTAYMRLDLPEPYHF